MQDEILQKLLKHLENSEDFILEKIPRLLREALKYEKINAFVTAFLMMALLTGALGIAWYFWQNPTLDKWGSRDFASFIGVLIPCTTSVLFFFQLCASLDKLIKIYASPKYFLIQLILSIKQL